MIESGIIVKKKKKGFTEPFEEAKIHKAIRKSAERILQVMSDEDCKKVSDRVIELITEPEIGVRKLHNVVEVALDDTGFHRVAESYRQYRNYKEDAQKIMEAVDAKTLELSYKEDRSNANADSLLVSTKRSILYGEMQKEKYNRIFLTQEELEADQDGFIYIHDKKDRLSTFNCFTAETRLVTDLGIKAFSNLKDGQKIKVLDKDGVWREATVGYFGKKVMYDILFSSGRSSKVVTCTRDHRWILEDGSVTTNIQVGDKLYNLKDTTENFELDKLDTEELRMWCFGFILGDGSDIKPRGTQVRLCGDKTKYLNYFLEAGYHKSSSTYGNGDVYLTNTDSPSKQLFLTGKGWKYLPLKYKIIIFNGYFAADGATNGHNSISTSDERLCEMIEDISACSGYHIASKKLITHDTNFKTGANLVTYNFRRKQSPKNHWIVKKINYHLHKKKEMDSWCIIEPVTHSFTLEGGIVTGNCCLYNLGRVLKGGFKLANTDYTEPKSLAAAMSVATDHIAAAAGQQYGGFTIPQIDEVFAPYAEKSYQFYISQYKKIISEGTPGTVINMDLADKYAEERVKREAEQQFQHMEYNLNTITSSRGDFSFTTFTFGHSTNRWAKLISEVFLNVRRGGQGKEGAKIPVLFPKLVFLYDSELHGPGKELEDLFDLAIETSKQCMYPDFLSLDSGYIGEVYHKWGRIISPMGLVSSPQTINSYCKLVWSRRFSFD